MPALAASLVRRSRLEAPTQAEDCRCRLASRDRSRGWWRRSQPVPVSGADPEPIAMPLNQHLIRLVLQEPWQKQA